MKMKASAGNPRPSPSPIPKVSSCPVSSLCRDDGVDGAGVGAFGGDIGVGIGVEADGGAGGVGVGACVSQGSGGTPVSNAGGAGVGYGSGAAGKFFSADGSRFAHVVTSRTIQAESESAVLAPLARSPTGIHAALKS